MPKEISVDVGEVEVVVIMRTVPGEIRLTSTYTLAGDGVSQRKDRTKQWDDISPEERAALQVILNIEEADIKADEKV